MNNWLKNTSFGDHVKDMSRAELIEIYGEEKGNLVADHFGIKKVAKKKVKKAEPKEESGED